jgi:hypothetical protein
MARSTLLVDGITLRSDEGVGADIPVCTSPFTPGLTSALVPRLRLLDVLTSIYYSKIRSASSARKAAPRQSQTRERLGSCDNP